jgi:hypothetical protein
MAQPDFYSHPDQVKPAADRHHALMWEVGDLLAQWEMLQGEAASLTDLKS